MTKGVQQRRGNTAQHASFNGQQGEITVNTDRWTVVVQDGSTLGGYEHVNINSAQRITNKDIVASQLSVAGVSTFVGVATAQSTLFANELSVSGIVTATTFQGQVNSGVGTITNLTSVDSSFTDIRSSGISTLATSEVTNLRVDNLTATGLSTFTSSSTVLIGTGTSTGTADQQLQVTGNAYIDSVGIGTTVSSAKLHLAAGTANANTSPLKFDPGVVLTTPEAGVVEYDGSLFYASPTAKRALNASIYYYANRDALTLANTTAAQNWLGVGVELEANTQYEFEGLFALSTTGTTSHVERTQFGGTASITRIGYYTQRSVRTTTVTGVTAGWFTATSAQSMTPAITTAQGVLYQLKGIVEINAAGTFDPQFSFSAAPGGTSTILAGAWFKIHAIGTSGSDVSIGTWA